MVRQESWPGTPKISRTYSRLCAWAWTRSREWGVPSSRASSTMSQPSKFTSASACASARQSGSPSPKVSSQMPSCELRSSTIFKPGCEFTNPPLGVLTAPAHPVGIDCQTHVSGVGMVQEVAQLTTVLGQFGQMMMHDEDANPRSSTQRPGGRSPGPGLSTSRRSCGRLWVEGWH